MSERAPHTSDELPRAGLRARTAPYLAVLSTGAALVLGLNSQDEARAKTHPQGSGAVIQHCELNFLNNGQNADCQPMGVKESCASPWAQDQLANFHHDPNAMQEGENIAVRSLSTARVSSTRSYSLKKNKHLKIGIQDIAAIDNNADGKASANLFLGAAMGAKEYRLVIERSKFYDKTYRERFDVTVDEARRCGMNVLITLAGDQGKPYAWTRRSAYRFGKAVASHYRGKVFEYTSWNEPNYEEVWLQPVNNKTQAATARYLYDPLRRGVKKGSRGKAKMIFGELSSLRSPIVFLKDVVNSSKKPLITDECISVHPYMFPEVPMTNLPPIRNENLTAGDEMIGIDGHFLYKAAVKQLYKQGKLKTPGNKMPGICYTEFALMSEGSNLRNIPEEYRAALYSQFIYEMAGDSTVKKLIFFQMDYADKAWNSGFVNGYRLVMPAYYAVQKTVQETGIAGAGLNRKQHTANGSNTSGAKHVKMSVR